jgi:hypothetical protein
MPNAHVVCDSKHGTIAFSPNPMQPNISSYAPNSKVVCTFHSFLPSLFPIFDQIPFYYWRKKAIGTKSQVERGAKGVKIISVSNQNRQFLYPIAGTPRSRFSASGE